MGPDEREVTHSTPYPCMWCGSRADSREHAIPKWMSKRLNLKVFMGSRSSRGVRRARHSISFASYRKRIFCEPCNTHFKHLEDEAIPLLEPMAWGRRAISLDGASQELLALWAAKTGMALMAASGLTNLLPQSHRDAVRYAAKPPDDCWVGYFNWTGDPNIWVGDSQVGAVGPTPPAGGKAYTAIFSFRRAGFMLAGFINPIPDGFRIGSWPEHPFMQVWPVQPGLVHWPPPHKAANEAAIGDLVRYAPTLPANYRSTGRGIA